MKRNGVGNRALFFGIALLLLAFLGLPALADDDEMQLGTATAFLEVTCDDVECELTPHVHDTSTSDFIPQNKAKAPKGGGDGFAGT